MKPSNLLPLMLGFAASAALAQSSLPAPADTPQQSPAPASGIETATENGFTYVCGGVGESEAAQMKSRAHDYDLMLTFATRKGEYLADVNVRIEGAKGAAPLQAMCGGPIMLVNMPRSGTYRIHAETGGYTLNKTTRVDTNRRRTDAVVMHWPQQLGESVESTGSSDTAPDAQSGGTGLTPSPEMPASDAPSSSPTPRP